MGRTDYKRFMTKEDRSALNAIYARADARQAEAAQLNGVCPCRCKTPLNDDATNPCRCCNEPRLDIDDD